MLIPRILVVEENKDLRFLLDGILKGAGYGVVLANDGKGGLGAVRANSPDLVLLDIRLPDMDGMRVLEKMKSIDRNIIVIMLTAHGDVRSAVKAIKLGAYDYLTKPFDNDELLLTIQRATEMHRLTHEVHHLKDKLCEKDIIASLIGESQAVRRVLEEVSVVAPTDVTVVLEGETGTGKELVARLIHLKSPRYDKPFVAVDCGAVPETLMESELFGYERGAFTGADAGKPGKFELSNRGTLFLDEITNLPDVAQAKLLRVVQEKKVSKLGGKTAAPIDVRIVVATNIDFFEAVRAGKFRNDLFYRLNEFPIRVPALRERKEDFPALAERFLHEAAVEFNKDILGFTAHAMEVLLAHPWPGNVRELRNTVRRAVLVCTARAVEEKHILLGPTSPPPVIDADRRPAPPLPEPENERSLHETTKKALNKVEQEAIVEALNRTGGNKTKAAKILQIDRVTLYSKMRQYGIER